MKEELWEKVCGLDSMSWKGCTEFCDIVCDFGNRQNTLQASN